MVTKSMRSSEAAGAAAGSQAWPLGGGHMAQEIRSFAWETTPMGPLSLWPQRRKDTVDLMLGHGFPMLMLWGETWLQIYNDGYRRMIGDRDPPALGRPSHAPGPAPWPINDVIHARVRQGETWRVEDQARPWTNADGDTEEAWFTVTCSPLRDAMDGIEGVIATVFETTRQHRAEAAQRHSEARYHALLAASTYATYRMAPDWSEMRELHGQGFMADVREPDRSWLERFILPADRPRVMDSIAHAIDGKGLFELEHSVLRADGSVGWTLSRAVPLMDEAGDITEWLGTASDVTRQHDALHRQGFLLRLADALRPLSDPLAIQDVAMRLLGEQLGISRAQYYEADEAGESLRSDGGYASGTAPAVGQFRLDDFGRYVGEAFRAGRTLAVADVSKDQNLSPAELAAYDQLGCRAFVGVPLVKNGRLVGTLGLHYPQARVWSAADLALAEQTAERTWDAMERARAEAALREAELRFRTMADTVPVLIWETDAQGAATFLNVHCLDFFGMGFEQLREMSWTAYLHPEDAAGYVAVYVDAVSQRKPYVHACRLRRQDGLYRWLRTTGVPLGTDRFIGSSIDITDLIEADKSKDEFLATLAHELRNPLAPIRNALQVLRVGRDKDAAPMRQIIERQTEHMVRLVEDLLDVSRISRGVIELRMERLDLRKALRAAIESSSPVIDRKGHTLVIDLPDLPLPLDGDEVRLAQVFSNLLTNAAKYSNPGARIELRAWRDGVHIVTEVRDNGIGIQAELLPRVFDLFAQLDRSQSRAQGGLGIGLSLAQRLTEMHGGGIGVASAGEGLGSTFTVRLPCSAQGLPAGAGTSAPEPELPPIEVLIVDDNHEAAETLSMLLDCLGAKPRVAFDGPSALQLLSAWKPAVVLLDIGMPGMDGHEVARRLRARPELQGLVLIALTGWGQDTDLRRSRDAGFDIHLTKPVQVETLVGTLRSLDRGAMQAAGIPLQNR